MASIITHFIFPTQLGQFLKKERLKIVILSVFVSIFPDADVITLKFLDYSSPWSHRGFTHSFLFGFLISVFLSWFFFMTETTKRKLFIALWLFLSHTSHGLFDAMTDGGLGVGFFIPFDEGRYFLPFRPLFVSPLDTMSFFSAYGLKILFSEFLVVVVPMQILIWLSQRKLDLKFYSLVCLNILGFVVLSLLSPTGNFLNLHSLKNTMTLYSENPDGPDSLSALPMKKGLTPLYNFQDLDQRGYFSRTMEYSDYKGWASGFYPNWYGGISGRWMNSTPSLILRSLFGFKTLSPDQILNMLNEDDSLKSEVYKLAPTEKYDIAMGDYAFHSTNQSLGLTHNSRGSKDYYGICNGVSFASNLLEEPYKIVKVVNLDGYSVYFHPNDVKALISYAYYRVVDWREITSSCYNPPFCELNPATLVLAVINSLGRSEYPLIIDLHPGDRSQFYPLVAGRIIKKSEIKKVDNSAPFLSHDKKVKYYVDVEIELTMNSTILSNSEQQIFPDEKGEFEKIGLRPIKRKYEAWLALSQEGNIVGGAWKGKMYKPHVISYVITGKPNTHSGKLVHNKKLDWNFIEKLHKKSIFKQPGPIVWKLKFDELPKNYLVRNGYCNEYSSTWKFIKSYNISDFVFSEDISESCL